ncbi:MAG: hypothetical protein MJY66_08165 [Bacteroidaceae bacterium]|nr:hypothetical protein [Bacteroidaceae bacterium]
MEAVSAKWQGPLLCIWRKTSSAPKEHYAVIPRGRLSEVEVHAIPEGIKGIGDVGLKQLPEEFQSKKFEKLLRLANFAAMTQEQQIEYTRNYLATLDRNSELNTATNKGIAICYPKMQII